ncbi:MAG TPA: DsrE family protein [Gaiellaceae bacterium]
MSRSLGELPGCSVQGQECPEERAVQHLRDMLDSLSELGTASLRESYEAIVAGGGRFYLSGMSSQARGVTAADLEGKPAEMAMPTVLVRLAFEHDRVLTY